MQLSLKILGVLATSLVGGAIIGLSINTVPLQLGRDALASVPRHETLIAGADWRKVNAALPDRYPMVTPRGRIEVMELTSYMLERTGRFPRQYNAPVMLPPPDLIRASQIGETVAQRPARLERDREPGLTETVQDHADNYGIELHPVDVEVFSQVLAELLPVQAAPADNAYPGSGANDWPTRLRTAQEDQAPPRGAKIIDVASALRGYSN